LNADSSAPTTAATIANFGATFAADGGDVIGESPGAMHRAASLSRDNDYLTTTGAVAG
jgi:hypothetical protein